MEKRLVCNQYTRKYDESQIVRRNYLSSPVTFGGRRYVDVSRIILESESYLIDNMTDEEVKEAEFGILFL